MQRIRQQKAGGIPEVRLFVDDHEALVAKARASRSMIGLDLAREVTCDAAYHVDSAGDAYITGTALTGPVCSRRVSRAAMAPAVRGSRW